MYCTTRVSQGKLDKQNTQPKVHTVLSKDVTSVDLKLESRNSSDADQICHVQKQHNVKERRNNYIKPK